MNKSVRLPDHIVPLLYKLTIKPDLESFTFSGKETIDIQINTQTKKITLHSKDIHIQTASVTVGKNIIHAKISYNKKSETAIFTFDKNIKKVSM